MDTNAIIAIAAPLLLLQFGLAFLALRDLVRPERRVKGTKVVWGAIIVFGQLLGPLAYFAIGRHEQEA